MNNLTIKNLDEIKILEERLNEIHKDYDAKNNDIKNRYNVANIYVTNQIYLAQDGLNKHKHFGFFDSYESKFSEYKTAEQNYEIKEAILDVIIRIKNDVENLYTHMDAMLDELFSPANDIHYQAEDLEEEKEEILEQIEDEKEALKEIADEKLKHYDRWDGYMDYLANKHD